MNQRALVTLGVLLGAAYGQSPQTWLSRIHGKVKSIQSTDPTNAALGFVTMGAAAFYAVERAQNPEVRSYFDALVFASTCLSAETCHIQAQTPVGKAIGSALRTYGPAIAARALDPAVSAEEAGGSDASLREVTDKLDQILCELVRQRESTVVS